MPRFLIVLSFLVAGISGFIGRAVATTQSSIPPDVFPVSPHNNVTIEWWYLNANVKTSSGRRLAIIGSFFRFGNASGMVAKNSSIKVDQSHYLIYAITDIDRKKHYTYSLGDKKTLDLLLQAAALDLERDPNSPDAAKISSFLSAGSFPPPTKTITDTCTISDSPFAADYGPNNYVEAVPGVRNGFVLGLNAGPGTGHILLTFVGAKAPMYVNGDGNTGLKIRTDMKYISLTRCHVTGQIDSGGGAENVKGEGWFDHQWGNSWTTQSAGWDWWGAQLSNGTDILFFQQLDLKTGKTFFPCATFEDAHGFQATTHHITFTPNPASVWTSPHTGISYPLSWQISFPGQKITLVVTPDMQDEEMPVLANGGAIWEGACHVSATVKGAKVPGVAYMELVGYNSPAVSAENTPPADGTQH